jgi:hypothetical protein
MIPDTVTKQVNIYWRRKEIKIIVNTGNITSVNKSLDYNLADIPEGVKDLVGAYLQKGYTLNSRTDIKNKRLDKNSDALRIRTESRLYGLMQEVGVAA